MCRYSIKWLQMFCCVWKSCLIWSQRLRRQPENLGSLQLTLSAAKDQTLSISTLCSSPSLFFLLLTTRRLIPVTPACLHLFILKENESRTQMFWFLSIYSHLRYSASKGKVGKKRGIFTWEHCVLFFPCICFLVVTLKMHCFCYLHLIWAQNTRLEKNKSMCKFSPSVWVEYKY